MARFVNDEACVVSIDRAFRGYRTQQVDAFLEELAVAQRAGARLDQLGVMLQERAFSVVFGGYDRDVVDRVIEWVTASWAAREHIKQLRDEAEAIHDAANQTLRRAVIALDDASRNFNTHHIEP